MSSVSNLTAVRALITALSRKELQILSKELCANEAVVEMAVDLQMELDAAKEAQIRAEEVWKSWREMVRARVHAVLVGRARKIAELKMQLVAAKEATQVMAGALLPASVSPAAGVWLRDAVKAARAARPRRRSPRLAELAAKKVAKA